MSNTIETVETIEQKFNEIHVGEDARMEESHPDGGYKVSEEDSALLKKAVTEFVKNLASNVLEGKDLVSVSLPVYIFDARSFLERIADNWACLDFATEAARSTDPVQRLKNVVAFGLSGLHKTCIAKKPFNPILGETYEAIYENGAKVFCEQTSHHPPVSHFMCVGPNNSYSVSGFGGWSASLRGNSIKGHVSGPNNMAFSDGTVISWTMPYLYIKGMMWGDRVIEYVGTMCFIDEKNDLKCEVIFHPDQKGFIRSFFSKAATPSDTIRGEIVNISAKKPTPLGIIEGTWLGYLDYYPNGDAKKKERLWDISNSKFYKPYPVENPLPSDCRFREDLKFLKEGNVEESQKWKTLLEEKQRHEAKLRKEKK